MVIAEAVAAALAYARTVPCGCLSLSSLGEVEGVEPKKVLVLKMLVLRVRNRFNLEGGMSDFDGEMVHRAFVQ